MKDKSKRRLIWGAIFVVAIILILLWFRKGNIPQNIREFVEEYTPFTFPTIDAVAPLNEFDDIYIPTLDLPPLNIPGRVIGDTCSMCMSIQTEIVPPPVTKSPVIENAPTFSAPIPINFSGFARGPSGMSTSFSSSPPGMYANNAIAKGLGGFTGAGVGNFNSW